MSETQQPTGDVAPGQAGEATAPPPQPAPAPETAFTGFEAVDWSQLAILRIALVIATSLVFVLVLGLVISGTMLFSFNYETGGTGERIAAPNTPSVSVIQSSNDSESWRAAHSAMTFVLPIASIVAAVMAFLMHRRMKPVKGLPSIAVAGAIGAALLIAISTAVYAVSAENLPWRALARYEAVHGPYSPAVPDTTDFESRNKMTVVDAAAKQRQHTVILPMLSGFALLVLALSVWVISDRVQTVAADGLARQGEW